MQLYVFVWGNPKGSFLYEKRASMKGRVCKVLARGSMNSCMIQFPDNNQREVVSRNSLHKFKGK